MVDGDGGDPHGPHRRACRVLIFFHVSTLDIWYVISKAGGNGKVIPRGYGCVGRRRIRRGER